MLAIRWVVAVSGCYGWLLWVVAMSARAYWMLIDACDPMSSPIHAPGRPMFYSIHSSWTHSPNSGTKDGSVPRTSTNATVDTTSVVVDANANMFTLARACRLVGHASSCMTLWLTFPAPVPLL